MSMNPIRLIFTGTSVLINCRYRYSIWLTEQSWYERLGYGELQSSRYRGRLQMKQKPRLDSWSCSRSRPGVEISTVSSVERLCRLPALLYLFCFSFLKTSWICSFVGSVIAYCIWLGAKRAREGKNGSFKWRHVLWNHAQYWPPLLLATTGFNDDYTI